MNEIEQAGQSVAEAIAQARGAAARAGVELSARWDADTPGNGSTDSPLSGVAAQGQTSYCFDLENLPNAADLDGIEAALEEIAGVRVDIVYPSKQAWVTVPLMMSPTVLERAFAEHGITAHLADSSLRRRVAWADVEDTRRQRTIRLAERMQRNRPVLYAAEERKRIRAKQEGFLGHRSEHLEPVESSIVLFTARALLTKTRLLWAVLLTIPVLCLSYIPAWQFDYWQWVVACLAFPVVAYSAWPFHRATLGGAVRGMSALDAASSVAISLSWVWSFLLLCFTDAGTVGYHMDLEWASFSPTIFAQDSLFFDVGCGMTVIVLAGRIAMRSTRGTLLKDLQRNKLNLDPEYAVITRNRAKGTSTSKLTAVHKLNVNDDIIIPPGATIPVDGVVIGGSSTTEALPLGQPPLAVKVNSRVYAGSRNGEHELKVRVTATGHHTWIAAIHRWVAGASRKQIQADIVATKTASNLIPLSFAVAGAVFVLWALFTHNLNQGMSTALAILACAAPTSLAVSASLATRQAIENAARHGVLVRDGSTLLELADVDKIIFNRVGALSNARMTVDSVVAAPGEDPDMVLRVAGALAIESDHPVSAALVRAYREARDATDGDFGGWIEATNVHVGADSNFHALVELPLEDGGSETVEATLWRPRELSELHGKLATAAANGGTPLVVHWRGEDRGVITLHDVPKADADEAVSELESLGIQTVMLSRDTYPVARRYADSLGVSHVLAGILPQDKAQAVRAVRRHGSIVAVVGDSSVNACFAVAQVGILLNPLANMADSVELDRQNAKVVVFHSAVRPIPWLVAVARRLQRTIRLNFLFAWAYHLVAITLAALGSLHPMVASLCMLGSSVVIELLSRRGARSRLVFREPDFRQKYEPRS